MFQRFGVRFPRVWLWQFLIIGIIGLLPGSLAGCGSAPPAGPTLQIPDAPPGPFVNIAGTWTGTFETANFPARTITMTVYQTINCVDGVWMTATSSWTGAISGFATADSFVGQISFERLAQDGGKCTAVGDISGPVGGATLHWKSAGVTAVGSCDGGLPQSLLLTLQRQE